jgi:hypothetical protein
MLEKLILPVAAFAATILGLESAWRWLGNQEYYNKRNTILLVQSQHFFSINTD